MNSHEVFIHIHQGCFAGTGAIVRLPQCQWSKPDGYGKISQCITTTKHSKAKPVCIFLGIYCTFQKCVDILHQNDTFVNNFNFNFKIFYWKNTQTYIQQSWDWNPWGFICLIISWLSLHCKYSNLCWKSWLVQVHWNNKTCAWRSICNSYYYCKYRD